MFCKFDNNESNDGVPFNLVTKVNRLTYKKKDMESDATYNHIMEIKPSPMCYAKGRNFQGLPLGEKRPPNDLLDVETYLRDSGFVEQINKNVIDDVHSIRTMDQTMGYTMGQNYTTIKECSDAGVAQVTKINKLEFPEWSSRMEKSGAAVRQLDYMPVGIDTRRQAKDHFSGKKNPSNKTVYDLSESSGYKAIRTNAFGNSDFGIGSSSRKNDVISSSRKQAVHIANSVDVNKTYFEMLQM